MSNFKHLRKSSDLLTTHCIGNNDFHITIHSTYIYLRIVQEDTLCNVNICSPNVSLSEKVQIFINENRNDKYLSLYSFMIFSIFFVKC